MSSQKYTPNSIVEGKIKFSIPLYQRLFAWSSTEIERLLHDLLEHFKKNPHDESSYYLGVLTAIYADGEYSLIDGQQRFTVMMLLGICFKGKSYADGEWEQFAQTDRLRFVARSEDQEYLKRKIEASHGSSSYENKKMEEGIRTIESFLADAHHFSNDEERKSFASSIFKRLSFFISTLPDTYLSTPASLNQYFELMNSAGRGLEQHEILKVELLSRSSSIFNSTALAIWNTVSDMNQCVIKRGDRMTLAEYRDQYEKLIEKCRTNNFDDVQTKLSSVNNNEVTEVSILDIKKKDIEITTHHQEDNEKSIINFSEFLLLVLSLVKEEEPSYSKFRVDRLLAIFEQSKDLNIQDFYHALLHYRLLLDYYIIKQNWSTENGKYTLLYGGETNKYLRQYQSMLFVSMEYYRWMHPFFVFLKQVEKQGERDRDVVLNKLKCIDNELNPNPGFSKKPLSYGCNRYWFRRLDYYLWENEMVDNKDKALQCIQSYTFRSNRSVEHLHPQNQAHNDTWDGEDIHSFGNLAMISAGFNSTLGNEAVDVKFARIKNQVDHSSLQSIKLYMMYQETQYGALPWTVKLAREHEKKMIKILKDSYHPPDMKVNHDDKEPATR